MASGQSDIVKVNINLALMDTDIELEDTLT